MALRAPDHYSRWMAHALAEARRAIDTRDVPVGALVFDSTGAVIGAGHNEREKQRDPTAHAEIIAVREASAARRDWRLLETTLVVTLEPCAMCAGAIVAARIPVVVFGAWDDKAGAAGSVYDIVRDRRLNHRVSVYAGVEATACAQLLSEFFDERRGD